MWRFLKKLGIELPYNPEIPLLGIHPEETRIQRDTCTPVLIAALFITARTWKQLILPLADEWIRKLWYIYTVEYYSAIKRNTFKSVPMRWMKLEPIIHSEVNQKETNTVYKCVYMEFRKTVMTVLHAVQQKRHRCKEQIFGLSGRRQGWDVLRE